MGTWLDGFEQITPAPTAYAGTMVPGAPRRFVCHFTQGFSANPAGAAGAHPNPPQLWVCPPSHRYRPGWRGQIYPLDVSARALNHDRSDPETNKQGAIQVEIEGYSEDAADLSREDLDWLADMVIGPACQATGVDLAVFIQGVGDSKVAAGRTSSTRMSWAQWRTFNGICSHQNVPGNDHWDAGGLDLAYISQRLTGAHPLEDDMAGIKDDPEALDAIASRVTAFLANKDTNPGTVIDPGARAALSRLDVTVNDPVGGIRAVLSAQKATGTGVDPKALADAIAAELGPDIGRQVLVALGNALPKS